MGGDGQFRSIYFVVSNFGSSVRHQNMGECPPVVEKPRFFFKNKFSFFVFGFFMAFMVFCCLKGLNNITPKLAKNL